MSRTTSSGNAAKYDGFGQAYYQQAAQIQQEYQAAVQRAKEELRGLQQRRKARESPAHGAPEPVAERRASRARGAARRLFGGDADGKASPTVRSIRGAF